MHRLGREGVLTHEEVVGVLAVVHRGIDAAESSAPPRRHDHRFGVRGCARIRAQTIEPKA
jgi:hypothetical protein